MCVGEIILNSDKISRQQSQEIDNVTTGSPRFQGNKAMKLTMLPQAAQAYFTREQLFI